MSIVEDLRGSRELLLNLTRREIKGKYKRTALGQLWSLANPLAAMAIYTVVFALIIRVEPEPGDPSGLDIFALWLLCGLLPWSFFTNVVNGGMGALVGNENLIKKVHFPRIALLVANSFSWIFSWSIEMVVLLVALLLVGANALPWVPLVVLFMALMSLFATGVALMLSVANVYFRDTQHFVGILFQVWFYLTPILYPVSLVAGLSDDVGPLIGSVTLLDLYMLNPVGEFVEAFRNLMYDNRWPELSTTLSCVAWAVAVFFVGYSIFKRHEKGLAEAL
ncbi:ABC-2 type transport system permease protein [Georgenia soli]|uniref:Transport permease protein n=1 Tax=Georgenia soli TaxID=638953 RepID=A0A2A9EIH3_9MICO|nr:ABC transporter permease [Georgenia soli]PFG38688.1 ABC-2 type transport system permease protein [Georgenia soli]